MSFMKAQNHFLGAQRDFEDLKINSQIPPKMKVKLDYLLATLLEQTTVLEMLSEQLPDYQKSSLQVLDKQTKVQLFINIVNCLSGKDIILYFKDEKAYIRKDETFSMWSPCYITLDSNVLSVRKKPEKKPTAEFNVVDIRISKKFKEYKRKIVMGFVFNKKQSYLVGFNEESACARIHQILRNLIKQKYSLKNADKKYAKSTIQSSEKKQKKDHDEMEYSFQKDESMIKEEMIEFDMEERGNIFQNIPRQQIYATMDYKLIKSFQSGRFLVNTKYPNKLKVILMLNGMKPANILQSFIEMNEWNPEIEECVIKTKLQENSYLLMIKLKRYSYFSWPRIAYVIVTSAIVEEKYYIVVRNVEDESINDSKDMVKMDFNQLLEVCVSPQNKELLLMTLITETDYRGYCSLEDSKNMSLKFLNNLQSFPQYLKTKEISSQSQKYFTFEKKKREIKSDINKQRKYSTLTQFDLPDDRLSRSIPESARTQKEREQDFEPLNKQTDLTLYMMKNDENVMINEELVKLIKSKLHQKYYLKHYFDQEAHIDLTRYEHESEGMNNYLHQGGKWIFNKNDEAIFTDMEYLQIQKGIFKYIVKQLGSNLLSGKSIMTMSLPVQIFEKRSILERIAIGFGYVPKFLVPAGQTEDLIEQAKLVTACFLGMGPLHLNVAKPFNPILGQTFEASLGGIPIYMEQISHHPPISAVYIKTDTFRVYGSFNSSVQLGLNIVTGMNLNPLYVQFFKTKTQYEIKTAEMQITGTMYGDRKYRSCGKLFLYEKTNNIFTQISYKKQKKKLYKYQNGSMKQDNFVGGIYTVTQKFGDKFSKCEVKRKFEGLTTDDIVDKHVQVQGHWAKQIVYNGQVFRNVENPVPNKLEFPKYVLPSDCNFRLDVIYKKLDNPKISNQEKEVLENLQRRDRKLRSGQIKTK